MKNKGNQLKTSYVKDRTFINRCLPFAALLAAYIFYVITFKPVLTKELADEIAYAKHLAANGLHFYATDWISTRVFLPFGVRFFMSFFAGAGEWKTILFAGVTCAYVVFAVSFCLLVFSLRLKAQKLWYAVSVLGLILGTVVLNSTYGCSLLITYLTFLFVFCGLIILSVKSKKTLLFKLIPVVVCVILSAFLIVSEVLFAKNNHAVSPSGEAIKQSFSIWGRGKLTDKYAGVERFFKEEEIASFYTTEHVKNYFSLVAKDEIIPYEYESIDSFEPAAALDEALTNFNMPDEKEAYVLVSLEDLENPHTVKNYKYGALVYKDDCFAVFEFERLALFNNSRMLDELESLATGKYNTLILNMYDNGFTEDMHETMVEYTGWDIAPAKTVLEDTYLLKMYADEAFDSENTLGNCVFRVDPYEIYSQMNFDINLYNEYIYELLVEHVYDNPDITFHIEFPAYSIIHYFDFDEDDFLNLTEAYEELLLNFEMAENVHYHFLNYDWTYENQFLYKTGSDIQYEETAAKNILLSTIPDEHFLITDSQVMLEELETLKEKVLLKTYLEPRSDVGTRSECVVVFGDSIFGNYKNSTGIQAIMNSFGDKEVVCEAIGGSSATIPEEGGIIWGGQLKDVEAVKGRIAKKGDFSEKQLIFIVEFGLNDYINGLVPSNRSDDFDIATYEGALNSGLRILRENWPDSRIILIAPGLTNFYDYGESCLEGSAPIKVFRDITKQCANRWQGEYIDFSTDINITLENFDWYCFDGVHYNLAGRMLIAKYLINYLMN